MRAEQIRNKYAPEIKLASSGFITFNFRTFSRMIPYPFVHFEYLTHRTQIGFYALYHLVMVIYPWFRYLTDVIIDLLHKQDNLRFDFIQNESHG